MNRCPKPSCAYFNQVLPDNAKVCPMCETLLYRTPLSSGFMPTSELTEILIALANKLPQELLPQVLEMAQSIKGSQRAYVLVVLANRLPEILPQALKATRSIKDQSQRARTLTDLADKFPQVLPLALEVAQLIKDESERAQALIILAKKQPEILPQALKATRSIKDESERAQALTDLANILPEVLPEALKETRFIKDEFKRAKALTDIVDTLPPELLPQALKIAQSIQYPSERARALTALVDKQPKILPQVLTAIQSINAVAYRVRALIALSDKLPETFSKASAVIQALAMIQTSRNEFARCQALIALANTTLSQDLLPQISEAIQPIQNVENRADTLIALSNQLPEVLPQALQAAQVIQDPAKRAYALIALSDQLPEVLLQVLEAMQFTDAAATQVDQAFNIAGSSITNLDSGSISYEAGIDAFEQGIDAFEQVSTVIHKLLRYPSLDCPDNATVDQYFTLTVELLLEVLEPGTPSISIEDTGTSELPEVEAVLRAHNFNIRGSNKKIMWIARDDDSVVTFDLAPCQLGEQQIRVDFYQHGRRIGTARRNILVSEQPLYQDIRQPEAFILEFKAASSVPPPDLELCIVLDRHDNRTLYYELHSVKQELDYHHTKVGQVTLQASPLEKMQAVYRELSQSAALNPATASPFNESRAFVLYPLTTQMIPERAERRLTAVGNQLWDELVPDDLKQQYWQFKRYVNSILITSDEPWVPWEMIKPYRHINGKEEQDPFWCQQFAISRWLSGPGTADDLPAKVVLPVAPTQSNLPSVREEVSFLSRLTQLRAGVSSVTALHRGLDLEDYIREKEFSILHFACHGVFDSTSPNDSAIILADGHLRPSDLRMYFAQKQPRPLIFMNACSGGRIGFSFTGLGGWAERLVKARVGAFVGAMWEVNDTLALQFARTFYKALLQDNQTVAESFRQSREAIRQIAPYNSTWLAYSLYGDPEARIREETLKASEDKYVN